ncbi:MAG: metal-dependent hydrolase [Ignavibacteria bacterium RIFOXYB2_FULL_35_12]|nr:MAG: metal-dependent hydrolase [Ignavibacteria bacterium GWA2_36_19]OGU50273.1 MAG: metal-dependent hydrolase [Ignavibacteria bacterium GWC2_35_8]OGU57992.1 MAG: metal-dependent hydrolase [Ignavibacteria bacterium GWF2_35_20]OGU78049.1 MAG: metal-dependent hydrolase [Ignavibacteria bacterium RIFOXYA2_FULL_35_9]OGU90521.1 MAG: metal-dependent hydrolase [Ignavibacteria bacterium RIFOXYC12_FULL_35_11]OGU91942.1 MAG: metal-dependent hydrolase [Ignavibacteria bacterium RIFOXYA12_FULL_35_25]OGU9
MKLKYFSHSAFQITTENNISILIDPFLDDNPTSPVKSKDVKADYIILTHGHGDHLGDSFKIAKRWNSTFICVNELANYCSEHGFKAHNMHIGGGYNFDFGRVKFTIAHHGSKTPDNQYTGEPSGVVLSVENKNVYHTGDTGLFYDMKLIGEMTPIDYMLLPIGDNFTMGITDAVKAAELVNPKVAIPMHYNTFPVINADPNEFKKIVEAKGISCKVLKFGEEIIL